jgi:hypothetical protein
MRSKWAALLIPFIALAALGFYRPAAPEPRALPLSVVFGSEINGYLTPCGCSKPMVGGIPRRATLFKQLAEKHTLLALENGDLTKAAGRQDELKAEALIEMLNAMGYDALNLGKYDFQLGMDYLRALQAQFKGTMLCGNVQEGGNPAFDAFTLVEKRHLNRPVRALIVGLISEKYADAIRTRNPHLSITPAAQQLDTLRPQIESMGDLRILLFYGTEQEATQLAQAHPYFHLIVYAGGGDGPLPTKQVGQTRLVFAGNDAKFVGIAHLSESAPYAIARVEHARLTEDFKDDEQALGIKLGYLARVEAEDLLANGSAPSDRERRRLRGQPRLHALPRRRLPHLAAHRPRESHANAHRRETRQRPRMRCVSCGRDGVRGRLPEHAENAHPQGCRLRELPRTRPQACARPRKPSAGQGGRKVMHELPCARAQPWLRLRNLLEEDRTRLQEVARGILEALCAWVSVQPRGLPSL